MPTSTVADDPEHWQATAAAAAEDLLAEAQAGESLEVAVTATDLLRARVHDGGSVLERTSSTTTAIRLASGGRTGFIAVDGVPGRPDTRRLLLTLARRLAAPDSDALVDRPFPPPLPVGVARAGYHDPSTALDAGLAVGLEEADASVRARAGVVATKGMAYSGGVTGAVVANSAGLRSTQVSSACHYGLTLVVDHGGSAVALYGSASARGTTGLDPELLAEETWRRATALGGTPTREALAGLPVVLAPGVTAEFLHALGRALTWPAMLRSQSFLAGHIGGSVAGASVTIVDDGADPRSTMGVPADGEGVATDAVAVIADGCLHRPLTTWRDAVHHGLPHTASAIRPTRAVPRAGARSLRIVQEPMAIDLEECVVIDEIRGFSIGFDLTSGRFSLLARGQLQRGGARVPTGLRALEGAMPTLLRELATPLEGPPPAYAANGMLGTTVALPPSAVHLSPELVGGARAD